MQPALLPAPALGMATHGLQNACQERMFEPFPANVVLEVSLHVMLRLSSIVMAPAGVLKKLPRRGLRKRLSQPKMHRNTPQNTCSFAFFGFSNFILGSSGPEKPSQSGRGKSWRAGLRLI